MSGPVPTHAYDAPHHGDPARYATLKRGPPITSDINVTGSTPRCGDVNQGARWYNPASGTFNSRDTMTYNAGVASSVPNLYAYAGGNPITFNDPDGHMFRDPEPGGSECYHDPNKLIDEPERWPQYGVTCDPPSHPPPPTKICTTPGGGKGCPPKGGDDGDGDGGCKKNCGPGGDGDGGGERGGCKTTKCGKPKPPKICDPQCQLKKKIQQERDQLEHDAKNIPQPDVPRASRRQYPLIAARFLYESVGEAERLTAAAAEARATAKSCFTRSGGV